VHLARRPPWLTPHGSLEDNRVARVASVGRKQRNDPWYARRDDALNRQRPHKWLIAEQDHSHRAVDIASVRREGADESRNVELRIVRKRNHRIPRPDAIADVQPLAAWPDLLDYAD
jgi:hypothetical protein